MGDVRGGNYLPDQPAVIAAAVSKSLATLGAGADVAVSATLAATIVEFWNIIDVSLSTPYVVFPLRCFAIPRNEDVVVTFATLHTA